MKIFGLVAALFVCSMGLASAQCGPSGCSVAPVRQVVSNVVQGVTYPVRNVVQYRQTVRYERQLRQTRNGVMFVTVPVYSYQPVSVQVR
jgi:hypothetical protein